MITDVEWRDISVRDSRTNSMLIEDVKQKIMQDRGSSNINLGIFVCSFYVCRVS